MNATILLVEDDQVLATIALKQLSRAGYTVEHAWNGAEAAAKANLYHYDLVLMDVSMPVVNGLSATKMIRDDERYSERHLPIIGVSCGADPSECLDAGMDCLFPKPADYVRIVDAWLPQKVAC